MIEVDHRPLVHAVRQRMRRVDARFENRPRHVELLVRQRPLREAGHALDERVLDRQTDVIPHRRRCADRQDRAAIVHELLELRDGRRQTRGAEAIAVLRRNALRIRAPPAEVARVTAATEATPTAAAGARNGGNAAVDEHEHVVLRDQIARVERLRIDNLERELVLLEHPADPARRHRTAVLIVQTDAHRLQLHRVSSRTCGGGVEAQASVGGRLLHDRRCGCFRWDEHRACRVPLAVGAERLLHPVDLFVGFQEPVDGDERVVHLMAEEITAAAWRLRHVARRRRHEIRNLLERTVEGVEDAVEFDPHRIRDVVAGDVVGGAWRSARIRDVVRVVLRLEHVHEMGAERLRRLHDIGPGRILFAVTPVPCTDSAIPRETASCAVLVMP